MDRLRTHYNTVRLHESIGNVTPTTSITVAAKAIHAARLAGLAAARAHTSVPCRSTGSARCLWHACTPQVPCIAAAMRAPATGRVDHVP
jgi:hypothetical protein